MNVKVPNLRARIMMKEYQVMDREVSTSHMSWGVNRNGTVSGCRRYSRHGVPWMDIKITKPGAIPIKTSLLGLNRGWWFV